MRRRLFPLVLAALTLVACRDPSLPAPPPAASQPAAAQPGSIRYVVGGDSRQDKAHVVPWAFGEAKARGVTGFVFLGDMELSADLDEHFRAELSALAPVPFYPVLGNHESVLREHGKDAPREDRVRAVSAFRGRFLGTAATPVQSAFDDKLVYSLDLPGGVHFVALDNVSQPGFGADQLAWLGKDLDAARADGKTRHIVVGVHKALIGSGVTTHAMEEDGPAAASDSAAALTLLEKARVELIVASHFHSFAQYTQHGIRSFITGGLGAPLDASPGREAPFHHFLLVGVPADGPLTVEVVRFNGTPAMETSAEH
jgi:hypothetical protein